MNGNDQHDQPAQAPRRTHKIRNTLLGGAVALVALIVISAALGGSHKTATPPAPATSAAAAAAQAPASSAPLATDPNGQTCLSLDAAGYCPGDDPAPSPTAVTPTKVTFIISGYAPGDGYGTGPTIDYGSDSSQHQASPASINGKLTYTMPYDGSAQYYSLNAQLAGSGHLSCKIVVTGPDPDVPTTVSHGSAEGGYSICSAQAAPDDPSGLTWQDEQ